MRRRKGPLAQAKSNVNKSYGSALCAATEDAEVINRASASESDVASFMRSYLKSDPGLFEYGDDDSGFSSTDDSQYDKTEEFMADHDEGYDSSDKSYSSDDEMKAIDTLWSGLMEHNLEPSAPPESDTVHVPSALEEEVKLIQTRQRDVKRAVKRVSRLQEATIKTMPDMEKARKRVMENSLAEGFRWLAFSWMGSSPICMIPRLLTLWVIGLPLLLMRLAVGLLLLYLTLGVPTMLVVSVTVGGTVPLQMFYRDVLKWAMHNDTFQDIWDAVASALAIMLSLLVYAIRLLVEIHNGFCPFFVLVADVLYEVAIQLTVIWYAAPALQYIALWLLRLMVFLLEPALDLLVTVAESFMFMVVELINVIGSACSEDGSDTETNIKAKRAQAMGLTLDEYDAHCQQQPEDEMCWSGSATSSQTMNGDTASAVGCEAAGVLRSQGEMLLEVVAIILITLIRVLQALLVAFMPIIYTFFRMVLPILLKLFPIAFELIGVVAAIFVSDPFKRILDFLIQAIPILLELTAVLLCNGAIYLGSAACYLLYAIVVYFGFYCKYILRPYLCGMGAFYGGCLEAFVMSMLDGQTCYTCGQYNTACGCRKATLPTNGCGSECMEEGTNLIVPAPPPTAEQMAPVNRTSRPTHYGGTDTNPLGDVVNDPSVTELANTEYGSNPDNIGSSGDSRFAAVPQTKGTQESSAATDTSIGDNPALVRRRTGPDQGVLGAALNNEYPTPAPTPVDIPTPAKPYNLRLSSHSQSISDVLFLSSPGFYADMVMVEVPDSTGFGTVLVPSIGTLPRYSPQAGMTTCDTGIGTYCDAEDMSIGLNQQVFQTGPNFPAEDASNAWEPAVLAPRTSPHFTSATQDVAGQINEAYTAASPPWLQLHFKRGHRITQLRFHWRASDSVLQAPESMSINVLDANGTSIAQFTDSRFCLTNSATRRDIVAVPLQEGQLAYDIVVTPLKSCAEAAGIYEFSAIYSLFLIEVKAVGDPLQLDSSGEVTVPTNITVSNPRLGFAHNKLRLWDPCGHRSLARLVDQQVGAVNAAPLLVSITSANGLNLFDPLAAFTFEMWPGGMSDAVTVQEVVDVTLMLRGPVCLDTADVLVCPYNPDKGTLEYSDFPNSESAQVEQGCTRPTGASAGINPKEMRESRARLFQTFLQTTQSITNTVPQPWLGNSSAFYNTQWPGPASQGPAVRNCGYQFRPSTAWTTKGFVIWLTVSAVAQARATTFETAQLELGLHPTYATSAQWTSVVAQHLDNDGIQVDATSVPELTQCPLVDDALPVSREKWDSYTNAFGSSSTARRWLAIDQVSARVYRSPADGLPGSEWTGGNSSSASRRLMRMSEAEPDPNTEWNDDQVRRKLSSTPLSWEKVPEQVSLDSVLMFQANPKTGTSNPLGHNQPYFNDLAQMPDPSKERTFECIGYNITNTTRMRCRTLEQLQLSHTSDEQNEQPLHSKQNVGSNISETPGLLQTKELQSKLATHQSLAAQQALLRRNQLEKLHESNLARNRQSKDDQIRSDHESASSSRKLLVLGMDTVKDWVTGFVKSALSGFESLLCRALVCSAYCHSDDGCDDNNLGDCFGAFVEYNLQGIFNCPADDPMVNQMGSDAEGVDPSGGSATGVAKGILSCIMRPVRDMFKLFIRHILSIFDTLASGLAKMLLLGDLVKMLACISCSIASIVSGVLMDFAQDFPISLCSSIVDKGEDQCNAWGVGNDDFGASVFGLAWPLIKLAFGIIQVLPAMAEVVVEATVIIFSGLIDVFPEIMGDLFDVLLWFITSSELIATVEILFEAIDPLLTGSVGDQLRSSTSRAAPASSTPDVNAENQEACQRPGETGGACGAAYQANATDVLRNTSKQHPGPITSESDLGFALGSCGCKVQPRKCADGVDAQNCPFQEGSMTKQMKARAALYAELMANQSASGYNGTNPTECPDWHYCKGMTPRTIGKGDQAAKSGQFVTRCVGSKQCKVELVGGKPTDFEKATSLPFDTFSPPTSKDANGNTVYKFYQKSDRRRTNGIGCPDDPNKDAYHDTFGRPDVDCKPHRRRRTPPPTSAPFSEGTQRRMARRLMGVEHLFSESAAGGDDSAKGSSSKVKDRQAEFDRASKGFESMMRAGNKSYAYYQVQALRREGLALWDLSEDAYENVTRLVVQQGLGRRVHETLDYTGRIMAHSRKLLFGFSGDDAAEKIGCGWADVNDFVPNTYPCCKGFWCCIPPPFPEDFYVDKQWFVWRDSWEKDTRCPYLENYSDGLLFAVRSICKLIRDGSHGVIGVWPYTSMVDAVWGLVQFPNDEWPDSSTSMWTCVGLNIGIYIVYLVILIGIVYGWKYIANFYSAHFVILQPLGREDANMKVLLKRSYIPTGTLRSRRRKEFNANL